MSDKQTLVYTAMPKYLSGLNPYVCKYVYEQNCVPLTPWQYPFWMMDTIDRNKIRDGNSRYITAADELWIFTTRDVFNDTDEKISGLDLHDGVLREVEQAQSEDMRVVVHEMNEDTQEITRIGLFKDL